LNDADAGNTRRCEPVTCSSPLQCLAGFQCIYVRGEPSCECTPHLETCNGLDDDCDGIVDNGDSPNLECNRDMPQSTCQNGRCTCLVDECVGQCTDVRTDINNCGNCGQICRGPASSCVSGQCQCLGERSALCGDRCVDLMRDPHHCGTCDISCNPQEACVEGTCQPRPSCQSVLACQQESCCLTLSVDGGSFLMGRGDVTDAYAAGRANEIPEHSVTVSPFYLDKYEVTGDRVARFLTDFDNWRSVGHPFAGEGDNENVVGTGWNAAWLLPTSSAVFTQELRACSSMTYDPTSISYVGPANCLTWYEAFAFCLWDGGHLPTEAEWEFAASGGDENRLFPWGHELPNSNLANCCYSLTDARPGSTPSGNGRFGQADLAGNVWEWVFDTLDDSWYSGEGNPCVNCANTSTIGQRVVRGSNHESNDFGTYRAAYRTGADPSVGSEYGFRCARTP